MGNTDSKVDFRVAVVQLTSRSQVNWLEKRFISRFTFVLLKIAN